MKNLKMFGLVAVAAMAMTAFAAGSASATTLEAGGVTHNGSITITGSLHPDLSTVFGATGGAFANTCLASHLHGATSSPFTGSSVGGPISSLTFSSCTRPVTVHKPGSLSIEHISSTTNGTVRSVGAEITTTMGGLAVNCKTGAGVDIGTLTGKASGHAIIEINATLNCGFLLPSAQWNSTLDITNPTGLGVSA